jgi:hypothetical protein
LLLLVLLVIVRFVVDGEDVDRTADVDAPRERGEKNILLANNLFVVNLVRRHSVV